MWWKWWQQPWRPVHCETVGCHHYSPRDVLLINKTVQPRHFQSNAYSVILSELISKILSSQLKQSQDPRVLHEASKPINFQLFTPNYVIKRLPISRLTAQMQHKRKSELPLKTKAFGMINRHLWFWTCQGRFVTPLHLKCGCPKQYNLWNVFMNW